jgi:hypothetical protein
LRYRRTCEFTLVFRMVLINGMTLPRELVKAIGSGCWQALQDSSRLGEVFPCQEPERPYFYNMADIRRENKGWTEEISDYYLGHHNNQSTPGDIDPRRSVLIGDLGHDLPIALDYRCSGSSPRVMYLVGESRTWWALAAANVGELLARLALTSRS